MIKSITYFLSSGRKATIKVNKKHQNIDSFVDQQIIDLANGYFQRLRTYNYESGWGISQELPMACTFNHEGEDFRFATTYNMSGLLNIGR